MKLSFLLGWGIVLYATMYLAWTGIVLYDFADSFLSQVLMLVILVFILTLAGRSLMINRWEDILPYSLGWLVMTICFDIVFAARLHGFEIFVDPTIWVSYALIVFVPLISPHSRDRS